MLRHRLRTFVFPMTGLFLAWYLLYVLLASYAPASWRSSSCGNINVGLVFGLLQFVSTFLITCLYVRFADRKLDPLAAAAARRHRDGPPHRGRRQVTTRRRASRAATRSSTSRSSALFVVDHARRS